MAYLTYLEYQDLGGDVEEEKFQKLLPKAEGILDQVTSYYYVTNDIEKDNAWRVKQFKLALVSQIDYFNEVGGTSFEAINKSPQSFSAGRTSVSNGGRKDSVSASKTVVAQEVDSYLSGTGLLYRGVSVW